MIAYIYMYLYLYIEFENAMDIKLALTRQSFILETRERIHYRARTVIAAVGLL